MTMFLTFTITYRVRNEKPYIKSRSWLYPIQTILFRNVSLLPHKVIFTIFERTWWKIF